MVQRLLLYTVSLALMTHMGYQGVPLLVLLAAYYREDVIVIALGGLLACQQMPVVPLSGYLAFTTTVTTPIGQGSLIDSGNGLLYWPNRLQYLGCKVHVKGIASVAKGPENPGGFNQKKWLKRYGVASLFRASHVDVVHCHHPFFLKWYQYYHQKLVSLHIQHIPEIESFLWGRGSGKNNYWYSLGLVHVFSLSGWHINKIKQSFYKAIHLFFPKQASGLSIVVVWLYVAFIQYPFCASRAALMLTLTHCKLRREDAYCLTLAVMLSIDPLAIYDMGAWFSFVAAGILSIVSKDSAYYLLVGLSPLGYLFGLDVQLLSLLANFLIMPLIIYWVFPLILVGAIMNLDQGFIWADQVLQQCIYLMHAIQLLHWPPMIVSLSRCLSLVALFLLRYWFNASMLWFLVLYLYYPVYDLSNGQIAVDVLSVGHGLSVLISTKHHHLLYDIGSQQMKDVTHDALLPFLNHKHILSLDAVVISHPDYDHYSGLVPLLRDRPVKKIWTSIPLSISRQQSLCQKGIQWTWDDVVFSFIHPDQYSLWKGNNHSCVLKVSGQKGSVLLTGDIEKKAEQYLVEHDDLASTILIAPHHGSKTSSSKAFIEAVSPKTIVISEKKHKYLPQWSTVPNWVYPFFVEII